MNVVSEQAIPGTGIKVTRERLLPMGVTGGFFAIGLTTLFLIPIFLWYARSQLAQGFYTDRVVLLIVHMMALGWATAVALGAWQQLSVVALQAAGTPRFKAAWTSIVLFAIGLPLMLTGMYIGSYTGVAYGGALIVGAFIAVICTSFHAKALAERKSVMSSFIVGALISLIGVGVAGILLGANRAYGFLGAGHLAAFKSHLYLGPVGWFGLLIPGVSYELAPFFGITRTGKDAGRGRHPRIVFTFVFLGVIGGLVAAFFGFAHRLLLLPLAIGYLIFVCDLRAIYRKRGLVRRTPTLTGVRASHVWLFIISLLLVMAVTLGSYFWNYKWNMGIGWIVALGWVTNAIIGYLHRILPFLFWHHRYWGKEKDEIKTRFPDMVGVNLGRRGIWLFNAGVAIGFIGFWNKPLFVIALIPLTVGLWMCVFNLGRAYFK